MWTVIKYYENNNDRNNVKFYNILKECQTKIITLKGKLLLINLCVCVKYKPVYNYIDVIKFILY